MVKVYVYYEDTDNSCGDQDCCGGPFPSPAVKVFATVNAAKKAGVKEDQLTECELNSNELARVNI